MHHSRGPDILDVSHPIYQTPSISLSVQRSWNSLPKENLFRDIQFCRYQRSLCYGLCHIPYKYTLLSPYHVTLLLRIKIAYFQFPHYRCTVPKQHKRMTSSYNPFNNLWLLGYKACLLYTSDAADE